MPKPHLFLPSIDGLTIRNRGNTPHWEMPDAKYSITYRLADAAPAAQLRRIQEERRLHEARARTSIERVQIRRTWERRIDELLDVGKGACHLSDERVASVIIENLREFDGARYDLIAWCVMPNHVHAVIRAMGTQKLERILHSWKSFTAKRANELLGRTGVFWQREYYDRIIRDEEDLERTIEYVLENPEKAGLVGWPWVGRAGGPPA